jgi:hypothetical protein
MRKDKRKSREPKGVYRVRNWSEYNAGLIARGSLDHIDRRELIHEWERGESCQAQQAAGLLVRNDSGRAYAQAREDTRDPHDCTKATAPAPS